MQIRFVGATIGRPLQFTGISDEKPMILYVQNIYRNYGLTIISAGDNGRPYRCMGNSALIIILYSVLH